MKPILFGIIFSASVHLLYAQNKVGINTTNPQSTLEVRGGFRLGGSSSYIQFDTTNGRIEWNGAALYVPTSQQIIRHSAFADGLYAGGGKLEYRSNFGPVFFSDLTNGNGYFSGNLGIQTAGPLAPIHVRKGASGAVPFNPSLIVAENDGFSYISLLSPSYTESGVLFGNEINNASGGIIYGNSSTPNGFQFRANGNNTKMVLDNAGRLGIGTISPNAPLSFPATLGKKITLYPGATGDVGMAVQGNLLQIYSNNPNADIAFGYDQGGTLTENFRVQGNGNVGIGTNSPAAKVHIAAGSSGATPYSLAQSVIESNSHTYLNILSPAANENGILFGRGTDPLNGGIIYNTILHPQGFEFRNGGNQTRMVLDAFGQLGIGTTTPQSTLDVNGSIRLNGTLSIAGSNGTAGQVLQSNGGSAPGWVSATNVLYNNTLLFTATNELTLDNGASTIPGLSYNFSTTTNAKVLVSFDVIANAPSCSFCGFSTAYIEVVIDGIHTKVFKWMLNNGEETTFTGNSMKAIGPNAHSVSLLATAEGPSVTFGCASCASKYYPTMIVQIIPQ